MQNLTEDEERLKELIRDTLEEVLGLWWSRILIGGFLVFLVVLVLVVLVGIIPVFA